MWAGQTIFYSKYTVIRSMKFTSSQLCFLWHPVNKIRKHFLPYQQLDYQPFHMPCERTQYTSWSESNLPLFSNHYTGLCRKCMLHYRSFLQTFWVISSGTIAYSFSSATTHCHVLNGTHFPSSEVYFWVMKMITLTYGQVASIALFRHCLLIALTSSSVGSWGCS